MGVVVLPEEPNATQATALDGLLERTLADDVTVHINDVKHAGVALDCAAANVCFDIEL